MLAQGLLHKHLHTFTHWPQVISGSILSILKMNDVLTLGQVGPASKPGSQLRSNDTYRLASTHTLPPL
jgi:hypothetical protein